ncbi:MAG: diguanylate cyclase [Bacillus sp. (in: Bacteria)]|nr:diguanylate cyclase [Bacillus sp. (in: firmicutes)]
MIRDFSERKKLEKQLKLNEQKYKSIVENNTDAVFMLDETGTFLSVNKSGAEVSGYKEEELLHKGFHQLVYEPELPLVVHHFLKALEGETQEYTMHFYHKNGNMIYSAVKNIPIVVDGKVMGIYGIARDITMEHLKYETLKSQEAYYRMLVDRSPDPTIIYQDGVFHYVNYAFARLMKAANRDVLVGKQLEDFIPTTQQEIFYQKSKEVLQDSADSVSMEGVIFTMEGTRREVEVFSTKTTFNHEPAIYAVLRDITEKKEIERKISKMAYFDFLTELPNRQLFKESLEEMMEGAEEKGKTFALLFLDGDNFKRINDMFGHTGGDEFLKEFAKRLKKSLRKEDLVARVGGDEFNILLPQVKTRDEIVPIIERLYEGMRKPWEYAGKRVTMTMSIGVAIFPEDGKSIKTLIHNADEALYSVKEQGGNHYMFVGEM